ncbi:arylsulfatase [Humibacillus xanthopallidus]|uniref:Arylsulfatase n=1 Tax=Humibacillus xanthopallidus TaxID=412689 RepID=A0A543HHT2_9MICO|nr:arylsulfatase [Humibacillus xanthopallidus]TQM57874.1 arylsulfatase [Humibacillus xanthopallidus]
MVSDVPREVLPIPDRPVLGVTTYAATDPGTHFDPITRLRPPAGAPNVVVILLDDVGFGASSAFGGPVHMPTAERLAGGGLRYTRFHTTAMCAPTRAALLTGRNHHSVGFGSITETATAAPGYNTTRPNTKATVQETLRLNGYATAMFGKCHEVPQWESSPVGPFDRWPTGSGFEYFYGFVGGETNQYYPALHEGTSQVDPPRTPEEGYTLNEDLADHAIAWIRQNRALAPDQPFFIYYAPGATHAPHHVPAEWREKYEGVFDEGWDALRERTFAAQKHLGIVPPDAELTSRHDEIPAWVDMPEDLKPILRRQIENYAGFLEQTDHHVGRVIQALEDLGALDDTLVFYIIGDNGASGEGTINGSFNEYIMANGLADRETPEFLMERLDRWGSTDSYPLYAVGWAHALCTPYQWTKQVASHFGGSRNGTIVHWPTGITGKGETREQFAHVIDIAATVLEVAGLPQPTMVHGVTQAPLEGTSMTYTFNDPGAADRHTIQYFEMYGNRGIYHDGWIGSTRHRVPWEPLADLGSLDDDTWELYDTRTNWTQAQSRDLAAEQPEKLAELQRLFILEASKYNVFPLDGRLAERFNSEMAGRPEPVKGNRQTLYPGMGGLPQEGILNVKNKSYSVTAEVEIPEGGAQGVIVNQGGFSAGWTVYLKDGRLKFGYNLASLAYSYVEAADPVPAGTHQVRMESAYDGGGLAKGATITLFVDGIQVGQGRIEASIPIGFTADETSDVGKDTGSPVVPDYPAGFTFTGAVNWVLIETGDDDHSHLITPEQQMLFHLAQH